MIARKYTKRVELWTTTATPDGFGGQVIIPVLIEKIWANVDVKNARVLAENGTIINNVNVIFTVRNRFDLNEKINFVQYLGNKYIVNSISNPDLNNIDLVITCTAQNG